MLLRRITKHVTDQNWFAVFIDFLIVVVGILIAFQITNWSEAQKDRVDESYYLNRLINDIDESMANNEKVIEFMNNKIITSYWVLNKLRAGQLADGEEPEFKQRFMKIGNWLTSDFIDSAIVELQSSGRLGIIQSKKFREHLGRFQLDISSLRRGQSNIADMLKDLSLEITARVDRGSVNSEQILLEITQDFVIETDLLSSFEDLANDKILHRYVERYAFFYQVRMGFAQQLQKALVELREQTELAFKSR